MAKKIPLNQRHGKYKDMGLFALVDDEDYEELSKYYWYIKKSKSDKNLYAARKFRDGDGKEHTIRMHRQILNVPSGEQIDHINGDGLCNIKSNLRVCTNSQNNMNKGLKCTNTSGYKGVYWNPKRDGWVVEIEADGERKYLGCYYDVEEAAKAYNREAIILHGEFAKLNELPEY